MARAIDKQTMLDLIIEAKRTDPETGSFAEWLAEYLVEHLPTLTPPNEALTMEQLREMDGEPVWVKCLKPSQYTDPPERWRILEKSIMGHFGVWNGDCALIERNYGTDWLAYRRPPEGEADGK
jgi:hypothetical protein